MIPWHPHTEPPAGTFATAILARRDLDHPGEWMLMPDIFKWSAPDGWTAERNGVRPHVGEFWYCLEDDLLAHLRAFVQTARNGHGCTPAPAEPAQPTPADWPAHPAGLNASPAELIDRLCATAEQMAHLSLSMRWHGGPETPHIARHADQLHNASQTMLEWARSWRAECATQTDEPLDSGHSNEGQR